MIQDDSIILKVENLSTYFKMEKGIAKAVDNVSFDLKEGTTLSIIGESGSGKSVTAMSIMGLIPIPPGIHAGGKILFENKNLLSLKEKEFQKIRGNLISMIFQEPMTSLNPVYTIGDQISEILSHHTSLSRKEIHEKTLFMLKKVGIANPQKRLHEYPHQMSGGMRQRVMIAMALSSNPRILIADEPTTALDVTIQAQILDLLNELQEEFNTSILFITHDLGVVAEISQDVAVMYAGKIVEKSDVHTLFEYPKHPYTQGLFNSIPNIDKHEEKLSVIPGIVPSPLNFPSGCRFRNRCVLANDRCAKEEPLLQSIKNNHQVACHLVFE